MSARSSALRLLLALVTLSLPALPAAAQSSSATIVGVVRDSSGGALPGVTVEVASPALIERFKTTTTTDSGTYQVVDLRPGEYTVTFTLGGFPDRAPAAGGAERGVHRDGERDAARRPAAGRSDRQGRRAGDRRAIGHIGTRASPGTDRRHPRRAHPQRRGDAGARRGDRASRRRRLGDRARRRASRCTARRRAIWSGTPTAST